MNLAFFLTPRSDVLWVRTTATVRQAIERMQHHRWAAVPPLDPRGRYAGTLSEGDVLAYWKRHPGLTFDLPLE